VDGFVDASSIGVGCAEPTESVREEIEVSGDNVEGAMLSQASVQAGFDVLCWLHEREAFVVLTRTFSLSLSRRSVR
jgi:hypothetical protein